MLSCRPACEAAQKVLRAGGWFEPAPTILTAGRFTSMLAHIACARVRKKRTSNFTATRRAIAFPKIDDRQLALLEPLGERRTVATRRDGFQCRPARPPINRGSARRDGGFREARGDGTNSRRRRASANLSATSPCSRAPRPWPAPGEIGGEPRFLQVPAAELRRALAELPGVGETLVNAFIMRRQRLSAIMSSRVCA